MKDSIFTNSFLTYIVGFLLGLVIGLLIGFGWSDNVSLNKLCRHKDYDFCKIDQTVYILNENIFDKDEE